jgi:hypothetical protein
VAKQAKNLACEEEAAVLTKDPALRPLLDMTAQDLRTALVLAVRARGEAERELTWVESVMYRWQKLALLEQERRQAAEGQLREAEIKRVRRGAGNMFTRAREAESLLAIIPEKVKTRYFRRAADRNQ